jgi:hypothetical protein
MEEITVGAVLPPADAPPGWTSPSNRDFDQQTLSIDLGYARGSWMARAEAILDLWDVPNVEETPKELLYTVEVQTDLSAGFYAATRFGYVDFRPLGLADGERVDWDHDVYRIEGSIGYRLVRNAGVLLSAYQQGAGEGGDTTLMGVRFWWGF